MFVGAGALLTVLAFGLAVGLIFVGGCLVGAWIQRDIGFVVKTKEAAEARKKKAKEDPHAVPYELRDQRGIEHPKGPPPPSPESLRKKRDPLDWRKDLATGIPDITKMAGRSIAE